MNLVKLAVRARDTCVCLLHMVVQIGQLRKGPLALVTLVGLVARVNGAHMDLQAALLRKELVTELARVLRKVGVPMIHDETLLLNRDSLPAVGHPTTPCRVLDLKRKRGRGHDVKNSGGRACSIFYGVRVGARGLLFSVVIHPHVVWVDIERTKGIRQTIGRVNNTFSDVLCHILFLALDRSPRDNTPIAAAILQKGDDDVLARNLLHQIQGGAVLRFPLIVQGHLHDVQKKPLPDIIILDALGGTLEVNREAHVEPLQGPEVGLVLHGKRGARRATHAYNM